MSANFTSDIVQTRRRSLSTRFRANGNRRRPHHYFQYIYPVYELIPQGRKITAITLPVTNAASRITPGPLPQDPDATRIFTISPSVEPPTPYQPISSAGEGLGHALGRISCYTGSTVLKMVLYRHNGAEILCISRETQVRQASIYQEEAQYSFSLTEWKGLHPTEPGDCIQQCKWVWWHNITDLLNRSNDRSFHSVQRQLKMCGKREEKVLWHDLPITSWTKTVPDSVLDDETIPYWERMELSVTQLDRNETLFGIKCRYRTVQFVRDALLYNIKWMVDLARQRQNESRQFNPGWFSETEIMLEAFEEHCPIMKDGIVRNWALFNELIKVSNEALVRDTGTEGFAVSDGWYSFREQIIVRAIKWLEMRRTYSRTWDGKEFLRTMKHFPVNPWP
ncbi:hypothetical protein AOQ84DRAFT_371679 [Glonium stellatum]|uniref:Uncharacterized protein n=1 Tax=Glonium stellatum TaxID=574774 RepID=A0A8E2FBW9_9PEZI|nr:hypothetical protein AOQ84DRAFT_371679 [Glonium stellatum]